MSVIQKMLQWVENNFKWVFLGVCIVVLAGCAGSSPPNDNHRQVSRVGSLNPYNYDGMEQRLRVEVDRWRGTPHRLGGTTRRGVDCSGFVQRLYRDLFSRELPRTTSLQAKSGRRVTPNNLLPGDLVFFKISRKGNHVGIYLGDNDFAHASSSRGVIVSSLANPYWRERYWTSRRYLNL